MKKSLYIMMVALCLLLAAFAACAEGEPMEVDVMFDGYQESGGMLYVTWTEEAYETGMALLRRVGMADREMQYPDQLSGGQKQRVAISRMLMQHAKIMIFDDSLSAVDAETDSRIRHALEESDDGSATRIIISHRITTLQQADKILVLRDGEVEEMGTHESLLAAGGTYSRVAGLQGSMKELDELEAEGGEA